MPPDVRFADIYPYGTFAKRILQLFSKFSLKEKVMSYVSNTFNVMIASPGDVSSERRIARDAIHEWNAVNSGARKIVLLPIGWETHSSPEMGIPPQQVINHQVLDKCDLLVAIFWTRLGTPTEKHLSGTVEEIEKHIASGKPAMLYFSSQPVAMDTVDPEQLQKLKEFKKSCQDRGLYESYDNPVEFKEKFYRHLQLKVNEHKLFKNSDINFTNMTVVESQTQIPTISQEAKILLKTASQDRNGMIIHARSLDGTLIQTNEKNLIPSNDRREIAKWEDALEQLRLSELVVDTGHKGQVFEITNLGYKVADMIVL